MIPPELHKLFWDINVETFDPTAYPQYSIGRVLEFGDERAVKWMKETFAESQITEVIRNERRLSRKSANFWALIYHIPAEQVAALRPGNDLSFLPPPTRTIRACVKGGVLEPLEKLDLPEGKEVLVTVVVAPERRRGVTELLRQMEGND
jgi:predicted DNA-binding antitoxin AbrB/MazE fold protein